RLNADFVKHVIASVVLQCEPINERLGNGLNGKGLPGVTDFVDVAGGRHEADAEPVWIGFGELGNVSGDIAVGDTAKLIVQVGQVIRHGRGQEGVQLRL